MNELIFDSGANDRDTAGDIGDTVTTGLPSWRANFSIAYDFDPVSVDARVRYVGGGKFND